MKTGKKQPLSGSALTDKLEQLSDLETKLETYRRTLTDIYSLYDKKIEELSLIRRLGDSIRTPLDLESLCREIIRAVTQEIAIDRLALYLVDQESLKMTAAYDAGQEEVLFYRDPRPVIFPKTDSDPVFRAIVSGQPVLLTSAVGERNGLEKAEKPHQGQLYLPLVARHRTVGLFSLNRAADQPFGDDDVRVLTIICDQAATALANVQLFQEVAATNVRLQESERQARQTSLYLESLLETANDVIFTLDNSGRITYVNRKVEEWGFSKNALVGRFLSDLRPEGQGPDIQPDRLLLAGGSGLEITITTAGGEPRDALFSVSLIPKVEVGDETQATYLVVARDITQRKQLERQLFHSEKLASIGILAAGVAHEIGNPLSAISGYAQILQNGEPSPEEAREYLAGIESQTNRIGRIIEDLLDYARPSTGLRSEILVSEAVPQIMAMLTSQRTFRNVMVEYHFSERLPRISMDRDHLAQIVVNICVNAAQAMPEGGRLTISTVARGKYVNISFRDTGPGIAPENQERIFDPFFTTKPAGQGTGLGLAICHRIVESYKGAIRVSSQGGPGAIFTVSLPAMES